MNNRSRLLKTVLVILLVIMVVGVTYYIGTHRTQKDSYDFSNLQKNNTEESITIQDSNCVGVNDPFITLLSPNGGETYSMRQKIDLKWESCGARDNDQVMITIRSTLGPGAEIATVPNTGSASITLPGILGGGENPIIGGNYYKIGVQLGGNAMGNKRAPTDESDATFTIKNSITAGTCSPGSAPSITVLAPNGGEVFVAGKPITVKWKTCNSPSNKVAISINEGNYTYYLSGDHNTDVATADTGILTATLPPADHVSYNSGSPVSFVPTDTFYVRAVIYPMEFVSYEDRSDSTFIIKGR